MIGLAWKFIRFDRAKSVGIVAAIVISIFLIGQQLSLLFFLMNLMGNLINNAPVGDNEIWVIEGQSQNINAINSIDQRLVQEIASLPNVEWTSPVVITSGQATFLDGKTAPVTLVGAASPMFRMGPVSNRIREGELKNLIAPFAVSAEIYNAKNWGTDIRLGKSIEINGKSAQIGLITNNAQAFGASLMYTTLANARHFGNVSPTKVSIVIVRLSKESMKEQVIEQINALYPNLRAWDIQRLRESSIREILITSNMGMSFGTLVLFAMVSGFFIIGLTLYSAALDRLKDYGTLKAIGAKGTYVSRLIVTQSFLFALIGYGLAMLLLWGFKLGVAKSGLAIDLSLGFSLMLLFLSIVISVGGSLFAVRRISKVEPASVF
ncbi:ABC transporter permease [Sphingobacterium sp. LRF_L2]|uniref:ABC transporter permease n=1 Tax=Sphingobacterium sp. LRF_L2 TaxID=3369421 RepID=UPI003F5E2C73